MIIKASMKITSDVLLIRDVSVLQGLAAEKINALCPQCLTDTSTAKQQTLQAFFNLPQKKIYLAHTACNGSN